MRAERHTDFIQKLKELYKDAEYLKKSPKEDLNLQEGKFFEAFTVMPTDLNNFNNINIKVNKNKNPLIEESLKYQYVSLFYSERRYNTYTEQTGNYLFNNNNNNNK
jgi:hypothetical protein